MKLFFVELVTIIILYKLFIKVLLNSYRKYISFVKFKSFNNKNW